MVINRAWKFRLSMILTAFACCVGNAGAAKGEKIYATRCVACHGTGVLGAPKLGVEADWLSRGQKGIDKLVQNAIEGVNAMPPKGGDPALSEEEVRSAVAFMLGKFKANSAPAAGKDVIAKKADPVPVPRQTQVTRPKVKSNNTAKRRSRPVNSFNRLMKPPSQRNLPPMRDGIHDAQNDGTAALQHPKEAFGPMPKANSGNRVDWVAALNRGDLKPRFDLEDENRKPVVLDLNIVREVKGSMPDVVYPHKQHTEWLDCSNCHPSIFLPKKGANNISMASILLGEQCGVCHGKVAFPVSECRKCHSKNKPKTAKK